MQHGVAADLHDGLTLASLYYWRRKLKLAAAVGYGGSSSQRNKYAALRVVDSAAVEATAPCSLVLRSGLRLELAVLPSPAWLLAVDQANAGAR